MYMRPIVKKTRKCFVKVTYGDLTPNTPISSQSAHFRSIKLIFTMDRFSEVVVFTPLTIFFGYTSIKFLSDTEWSDTDPVEINFTNATLTGTSKWQIVLCGHRRSLTRNPNPSDIRFKTFFESRSDILAVLNRYFCTHLIMMPNFGSVLLLKHSAAFMHVATFYAQFLSTPALTHQMAVK